MNPYVLANGRYALLLERGVRDKCQIQIEPMSAIVTSKGEAQVPSSFLDGSGSSSLRTFKDATGNVAVRLFIGRGALKSLFVQNNRVGQSCYVQLHDTAAENLEIHHPAKFFFPLPPGGDCYSEPMQTGYSTLSVDTTLPFNDGCILAYSHHETLYVPIPYETPPAEPVKIPQWQPRLDSSGNLVPKTEKNATTNTIQQVYVTMDPLPYKACHGTYLLFVPSP